MAQKRKPSQGKTRTRWRGPEGKYFARLVEEIRYPISGKVLRWKAVCDELESRGYGIHKCPDKLKADYHNAVRYWDARSWHETLRGPDGWALIELIQDMPCSDDGEVDWAHALTELHSDDRRMTAKRLKARYTAALKYWRALYRDSADKPVEWLSPLDFLRKE